MITEGSTIKSYGGEEAQLYKREEVKAKQMELSKKALMDGVLVSNDKKSSRKNKGMENMSQSHKNSFM